MAEIKSIMVTTNNLINQTFLSSINERLSTFGFSPEDFKIIQQHYEDEKETDIFIRITYRHNDTHHFTAIMTDKLDLFSISYSPGTFLTQGRINVKSVTEYLLRIHEWVETLRVELKASPLGRQISQNEEKIKEIENLLEDKFKEDNNSYFSIEEGNELKNKLDELEKLFKEKIGDIKKDESSLIKEREQLHKEVEMLKEQVAYLSKKKWGTALAIKVMNWTSRNPEAAKQIGQAGLKMLLPQEIEESISTILPEPQNKK